MGGDGGRVVTELRVRRATLALTRSALIEELKAMDREAGGLDESTLRGWERRAHVPCAFYQRLLRERFQVASVAVLGLGHHPDAVRWWTLATPDQTRLEVYRRRVAMLGVEPFGVPLLPLDAWDAAARLTEEFRRRGC